jgi:hypothetical protein
MERLKLTGHKSFDHAIADALDYISISMFPLIVEQGILCNDLPFPRLCKRPPE